MIVIVPPDMNIGSRRPSVQLESAENFNRHGQWMDGEASGTKDTARNSLFEVVLGPNIRIHAARYTGFEVTASL